MPPTKLTKRTMDSLVYAGDGSERFIVWDTEIKGYGLRVYPTGRKAFVFSYRADGRKRLITIGTYGPGLTPDQARKQAGILKASVLTGSDPLAVRQKAAQGDTIKDLCAAYLERHAKAHKRSWTEDQRRIDNRILPVWRNRRVSSITRADVAALHTKIGNEGHPYEANRVLALLSKVFDLAGRWGYLPDDKPNPAHGIDRYREQKRDRWVTPDELPALVAAIDQEANPYIRAALWLYLLIGTRKSELLQARWEDIDWNRQELKLPQTKAGRSHYIPLTGPALELLRQLPRLDNNPYILPGRVEGRPLVNIGKAWRRVRSAAGVADVRLHDLRRTVGSWLAQSGNSLHLIGRVLNHSNSSTTAIYARFGEDHVRAALETHATRLLGVAGKIPTAEVVPIDKADKG